MIDLKQSSANALLDGYDDLFPAGSVLELRSGAPAGADNAAGGTLLASITLPAGPWAAAAAGAKAKQGVWADVGLPAAGAGTNVGHYRLRNAGDTEREEGTVTGTGGGGELELDNVNIAEDQAVSVTTFTRTL